MLSEINQAQKDKYDKINKNMYSQKLDIIMLIAALFLKTKMWKQPKCPTIDKLISKMYLNVSA